MRSATIDLAKGVGIVMVSYGHSLRGLTAGGYISDQSWLQITDYVIYTFGMPLFFFISGLFIRGSMQKGEQEFWWGRLSRIVYPYFFWSLLQGGIQASLSNTGATNGSLSYEALLEIAWNPISPFWFLYALFFASLAAWLFRRTYPELLLVLAGVAMILTLGVQPPVLNDVAYGTFYLALGIAAREWGWFSRIEAVSATALVAVAVLFAVCTAGSYALGLPDRLAILSAVSGLAGTLMASALAARSSGWVSRFLIVAGRNSMAIYVMHILAIGFMRLLLVRGLHITSPAVLLVLCTVAGLVLPLAAQNIASRLRLATLAGLPSFAPATNGVARL